MLEVLARAGAQQKVHLIYGVTRDLDLVLVDAIEAYAAKLPNFSFATSSRTPRRAIRARAGSRSTSRPGAERRRRRRVSVRAAADGRRGAPVFRRRRREAEQLPLREFTPTSRQRRRDHATILWQGHRRHGRSARHRPWRRDARGGRRRRCCSSIARISSPTSRPKRPVARRPASSPISKPTKVRMRRSHMPRRRSAASTS